MKSISYELIRPVRDSVENKVGYYFLFNGPTNVGLGIPVRHIVRPVSLAIALKLTGRDIS